VKTDILVALNVVYPTAPTAQVVIRKVLPVTTLIMLVIKKTTIKMSNWITVKGGAI
jgi:hypothetical protein